MYCKILGLSDYWNWELALCSHLQFDVLYLAIPCWMSWGWCQPFSLTVKVILGWLSGVPGSLIKILKMTGPSADLVAYTAHCWDPSSLYATDHNLLGLLSPGHCLLTQPVLQLVNEGVIADTIKPSSSHGRQYPLLALYPLSWSPHHRGLSQGAG